MTSGTVPVSWGASTRVVAALGHGDQGSGNQAWDTDANCDPESANAVVQAIIENAIDPLRSTLDHVVVVGGDPIIPMARLLDSTEIANEYDFRHEFIGDNLYVELFINDDVRTQAAEELDHSGDVVKMRGVTDNNWLVRQKGARQYRERRVFCPGDPKAAF